MEVPLVETSDAGFGDYHSLVDNWQQHDEIDRKKSEYSDDYLVRLSPSRRYFNSTLPPPVSIFSRFSQNLRARWLNSNLERQSTSIDRDSNDRPLEAKWNRHLTKQRKLIVYEVQNGASKRMLLQTPELLRLIHLHNKNLTMQDSIAGSVKLRDLRQICAFNQIGHFPSIEPRRNCILVNLPRNRCVIFHNKVLFIGGFFPSLNDDIIETDVSITGDEITGDDLSTHIVDKRLIEKLICLTKVKSSVVLEFALLEVILVDECSLLNSALTPVRNSANALQRYMKQYPGSTLQLRQVTELKRALDALSEKVKGSRHAVQTVLSNEEDIRRLEISRFWDLSLEWENPKDSPAAEDAEILLECYEQELQSTLQQLRRIDEELDDGLQIMNLHMAIVRNTLIKSEIGIDVVALAVGMVGALSGIFGMNIPNNNERNPFLFRPLVAGLASFICIAMIGVVVLFRRLRL